MWTLLVFSASLLLVGARPESGGSRPVHSQHSLRRDLSRFDTALQAPSGAQLAAHLFALTRAPSVFGTAGAAANAQYIHDQLQLALGVPQMNASVTMQPFRAWSNLPDSTFVNSVSWAAAPGLPLANLTLDEPVVPEDPTSGLGFPLYNGYSANSNPSVGLRNVVYANYCQLSDFQFLKDIGVTVAGCVVLCRYGAIFRGQKALYAEQFGAVAVIIYSDPADDGYVQGPEYPAGPGHCISLAGRSSDAHLAQLATVTAASAAPLHCWACVLEIQGPSVLQLVFAAT
jgi:N-acetylated-alpha-linked acidic dipeptidase